MYLAAYAEKQTKAGGEKIDRLENSKGSVYAFLITRLPTTARLRPRWGRTFAA